MTEHIGFIGVGTMGAALAGRLLDAGYKLTIYDLNKKAVADFVKRGAKAATSPAHVASNAELVFVCLPKPDDIHEVAFGKNGIASGNKARIYVDFSTTGPTMAGKVSEGFAKKNIAAVDAAMGGTLRQAKAGTLTLLSSGPKKAFKRVEPILQNLSSKICYVSERTGDGQLMKVLNNFLSLMALVGTTEAVMVGAKYGLDPDTIIETLNDSPARNNATETKFPVNILTRNFDHGFMTKLMYKDIGLFVSEAENMGVPVWLASNLKQIWAYYMSQNGGDLDSTRIVEHYEKWAGVKVIGKAAKQKRTKKKAAKKKSKKK